MIVEWNDTYSIGISEIDEQHRHFFDLLNKSHLLISNACNQSELSKLLDDLIDYSKYHFDTENELMTKHNYINTSQHNLEHFIFTQKVLSYKKDLLKNDKYLSGEVFSFIKSWLIDHIIKTDLEMSKSIRFIKQI